MYGSADLLVQRRGETVVADPLIGTTATRVRVWGPATTDADGRGPKLQIAPGYEGDRSMSGKEFFRRDAGLLEYCPEGTFGEIARMIWDGSEPVGLGIVPDFVTAHCVPME